MGGPPVVFVVGARPQFIKAAALGLYLGRHPDAARFTPVLVHSGQHYDAALSDVFFAELPVPAPDVELGVGEGPPAVQFGQILERLSTLLDDLAPAAVAVYGDTTTTLAAGLAAAYRDIPVVHIEAGERAYRRWRYPEETNRVLTDHLSALCLTATERAARYLADEGVAAERVRVVGDVMYDLFVWAEERLGSGRPAGLPPGIDPAAYDVATVHRAENTDDGPALVALLAALDAGPRPVVLPAHPRLTKRCRALGWAPTGALHLVEPVGYLDMVGLVRTATTVVTDSGGLMREAFFAGRPCVVPLEHVPWRELVETGWAVEVGRDVDRLRRLVERFPRPEGPPPRLFGDGTAGAGVVRAINEALARSAEGGPGFGVDDWSDPRTR